MGERAFYFSVPPILVLICFCCSLVAGAKQSLFDQAETELTLTILPQATECFYQKAKRQDYMDIEYQVIDANFGELEIQHELDISFSLISPSGKELISEYKRRDAMHRHEVKEDGDYKLCFDNSHSHFTKKTLYFEVYIDSDEDADYANWDEYSFSPELMYNDTIEQIKLSITKVHANLDKVKHHQDQMKAIESRDRNTQEHNFTRVNHFSILFIVVMLIVGAIQVIMVRSLFEEKSALHKLFRLLS